MLIESQRLTDRDRLLWREWLKADELQAKTAGHKRRVSKTYEMIAGFVQSEKRYFAAVSWGKDSVVLAHLMYKAGARCKYIYVRNLAREPEGNAAVRDEFLRRFPVDYEEISYDYADADETYYDRAGNPCKWRHILAGLQRDYGCHVTGIRCDESAKRRRRFRMYGAETEYSFAPFRYITAQDIFAYLWANDLPVHPNYAMTGGGRWDKYRIRVAAIGNPEGDGIGRAEWEREYYSDVLNRLSKGMRKDQN